MAGKKMRSRKGNAHTRKYDKSIRTAALNRTKQRRKVAHEKLMAKQFEMHRERMDILEQCMEEYRCSSYLIKRLIGTPNSRRLSKLLDGSFINESWFTKRTAVPRLRELIVGTSVSPYILDAMIQPNSDEEKEKKRKTRHGKWNSNRKRSRRSKSSTD